MYPKGKSKGHDAMEKELSGLQIDIDSIADRSTRVMIRHLFNVIERQAEEVKKLQEENQALRDENNHLKGEQGQPKIRKQTQAHISSESERKNRNGKKQRKKKKSKKQVLVVHKVERRTVEPTQLPSDAEFKGYQSTIIQDILIAPHNIRFEREVYYSPSQGKRIIAPLPEGYRGDFAPELRALILELHHTSEMTESAIHGFLETHGIDISTASISRILTDKHETFHQEKKDIVCAGLKSTQHQQMDDTGARVSGKNHYMHILCNDYYTAYFTRKDKTRLTVIDILSGSETQFHFNESTYKLMEQMQVSKKMLDALKEKQPASVMNRDEVDLFLKELLPVSSKQHTNRQMILEASAVIGYRSRPDAIKILLTDDAPQFKQITEHGALCWVHDGRHYKKLSPVVPLHRAQLDAFLTKYWDYYHELLQYKEKPSSTMAEALSGQFDRLFSTTTGYLRLDERISKTKSKKDALLLVLQYPGLPLHNNTSELGARKQARYRDISFHTTNKKGTEANDTFKTIIQTAKKLGVNSYRYLRERISGTLQMPSLPALILAQADSS
jgi:predicted ester cyclase